MNLLKRFKDKDKKKNDNEASTRELPPEEAPQTEEQKDGGKPSMTDKAMDFMKPYLKQAQTWTAKEASDAKKELQKYAGLGSKPNVVPPGEPKMVGEPRAVELGWHPVAGATGKWFAEKTIIGTKISQKIGRYPDPTQHWAIIVGDYVHQLWMDENLDIIYINEPLTRTDWHIFPVGETLFNDQAIYQASQMTIFNMRATRPAYNLISNNCQNFATELLKAIQVGAQREFGTTFAIYQRAVGRGAVRDLFVDKDGEGEGEGRKQDTVGVAQKIMEKETKTLEA